MPPEELQTEVRRLENKMEAMQAGTLAAIKEGREENASAIEGLRRDIFTAVDQMRRDNAAAVARIEARQSDRDKVCASANAANLSRDREICELKDSVRNYAAYDARIARIEVSVASLVKFGWIIVAAVAGLLINATWATIATHMAVKAAGG